MSATPVEITFLSKADIDQLITWEDVLAGVEDAFRSDGNGQMVLPESSPLALNEQCMLLPMVGHLKDLGVLGQKWMRFFPTQPDGIPTLWGQTLLLNDARTGLPIAVMDATTITAMRTSGGHAVVAARYLASPDPRIMGVLGAGAQGKAGIESFDLAFQLEEIRVYTPRESTRESCRRALNGKLKARLVFVDTPAEVARDADILLTCSGSRETLLSADGIPTGCFVAGISKFTDLDSKLAGYANKWVLGHRNSDKAEIVDKFDGLSMEDVYSSLGEIVTGQKPGRESDQEIILFTHAGMGSLDVAVGSRVLQKAVQNNVGRRLRLI